MNQPALLFTRDRMAGRVPALIQALSGRGWVKGRDLSRLLDCDDRTIRALAHASRGRVISGQRGYCLIEDASVSDANHAASWLEHQGREMIRRAYDIRRAMHQRRGAA